LRIGANISPLEAEYNEVGYWDAIAEALRLNLDYVRIGAYWNEIERRDGEFDFSHLDPYLEAAEARGVPVILTMGMKTPVWPEFHIPWWVWESIPLPPTGLVSRDERLRDLAGRFVRRVAERYAGVRNIVMLQVENEPFEPVLTERGWTLDESFLRQQVGLVREADRLSRPILLTAYVATSRVVSGLQQMIKRPTGRLVADMIMGSRPDSTLIDLADVVGLDVYPGIGWLAIGQPMYLRAESDEDFAHLFAWRDAVEAAGKGVMIAEAQAKPWEPGDKAYKAAITPSFMPEDLPGWIAQLAGYGFGQITLWGVEHWIWHRDNGNADWWRIGERLLADRSLIPARF
jgi:hypothetical protein